MKADELLADADLVPALEGAVNSAKEFERALLAQDIPVMLAAPPKKACCGGACGCGSKLQVLVRPDDVPRVGAFMQREWLEAVKREGVDPASLVQLGTGEAAEGEALACPACGFKGDLVEGACGDCGLQLE
jgi:DNA-directed RNA polymerase subunit RPC12/RpoP